MDTQRNELHKPSEEIDTVAELADRQTAAVAAREAQYKQKIVAMLEPLYPNHAVSVSLVMDFDQVSTTETKYDPEGAILSEDTTTEESTTTEAPPVGPAGTIANVPLTEEGAPAQSMTKELTETTTTNFELSKTETSTMVAPGTIKRLSVSAMIEGRTTTTEDGELQYVALTDDERSQIEGLIVAAVGADLTRGDSVVVYDAQFDTSAEAAAATAMGEAAREMRRRAMMEAARQLVPAVVVGVALVVLITMLRRLKPMERAARVAVEAEDIRPSEEALAKERMQEEVAKLSQEQPETVANLLKTWLAETE